MKQMAGKKQRQRGRSVPPPSRSRYPSPAERERIIARRNDLMRQLITATVIPGEADLQLPQLIRQYGSKEIGLVMGLIQKSMAGAELIGDEARVYRDYRQAYARFGGDRPFLSQAEHATLMGEYVRLNAPRIFQDQSGAASEREQELYDLLLIQADYWADITPPAVPPRPSNFHSPTPGSYSGAASSLLARGWDLNDNYLAEQVRKTVRWANAVPDLAAMALDAGLLDGWPGETPSWAPYHALVMLGLLRAHEHAGDLLALLDQENDWLSDRLPVAWARMGPQAEPALWTYVDSAGHAAEQRGVALKGLQLIAQRYADRRSTIVQGFMDRLDAHSADDAELNAYIVHMLNQIDAVEARDAIARAFEQGKIDTTIMTPDDVDMLGKD